MDGLQGREIQIQSIRTSLIEIPRDHSKEVDWRTKGAILEHICQGRCIRYKVREIDGDCRSSNNDASWGDVVLGLAAEASGRELWRVVVDFRRVNKYGRGRLDCREMLLYHNRRAYAYAAKRGLSYLDDYPRQVITGYKRIDENDQEELLKVRAQQLVAVAMMIYPAYKKQKKGIYYGPSNGEKTIVCGMHSVLIVGYNKKTFFILNSYGIEWGDNGDVEVAQNVKIFDEEKEEWRP
ncbi:hypothetical protein ACFE04_023511 [Oxalis oulophora]